MKKKPVRQRVFETEYLNHSSIEIIFRQINNSFNESCLVVMAYKSPHGVLTVNAMGKRADVMREKRRQFIIGEYSEGFSIEKLTSDFEEFVVPMTSEFSTWKRT